MARFVFTIRNQPGRAATPDEQSAWHQWFEQIGSSIADFGRVSETRLLGSGPSEVALTSYAVVDADSLEAAVALAEGCPGLSQGGGVEIGQIIEP
ncbi:MAG: hypothetical protein ABSA91_15045 [Acidimicrobiales bacterium]|jgi:hypothetical protein